MQQKTGIFEAFTPEREWHPLQTALIPGTVVNVSPGDQGHTGETWHATSVHPPETTRQY
jgi:hypothetical protein